MALRVRICHEGPRYLLLPIPSLRDQDRLDDAVRRDTFSLSRQIRKYWTPWDTVKQILTPRWLLKLLQHHLLFNDYILREACLQLTNANQISIHG